MRLLHGAPSLEEAHALIQSAQTTLASNPNGEDGEEIDEGGTTWRIRTLLANHPMSQDEAMGLARRYAERKNIPVVVTDSGD